MASSRQALQNLDFAFPFVRINSRRQSYCRAPHSPQPYSYDSHDSHITGLLLLHAPPKLAASLLGRGVEFLVLSIEGTNSTIGNKNCYLGPSILDRRRFARRQVNRHQSDVGSRKQRCTNRLTTDAVDCELYHNRKIQGPVVPYLLPKVNRDTCSLHSALAIFHVVAYPLRHVEISL